jgi:hypothetical protein
MFVRVSDKIKNRYYKSLVYGLVNRGFFEQAIVINPYTKCFELVHYLEKADPFPVPIYEVIQPERTGWITASPADLIKMNLHSKNLSVDYLSGFEDILNNHSFLSALLDKKYVHADKAGARIRGFEDGEEWNYIITQADADAFMNLFEGFHDSFLNKLTYEEDHQTRKVTVIFDNTCWYGVAELCFEGLVAMNLRPAQENFDRFIYGGTLLVKDECIFWADDALKEENLSYEGSYIKALNLKWRKIG